MSTSEHIISKNQDVRASKYKGDELSTFTFCVGGAAGDGIMSAGKLFSTMLTRNNYYVQYYTEYPSLIRGGHNAVFVRVSEEEIHSQVTYLDILFAINLETIELHVDEVVEGGSIVYDPSILRRKTVEEFNRPDIEWRAIPLRDMTNELNAAKIVRNTIGLGAIISMLDLPLIEFQEILSNMFARRPAIAELNTTAAEMGYKYMAENYNAFKVHLKDMDDDGLIVMTGNAATAAGLIAGGIGVFTGYPMSPATSLLEYMVKYAADYEYMVLQAEDEISAVAMAIGANHTGARSATGTSGGGLALMTEPIGLAGSAEIPLVVVNVQRPGPSTGLPTWTGQADLLFSVRLGQDSFPRIILAPGDIKECYDLAVESLNLAEEFQVPVLLLTDKWLGTSGFTTKPFTNDGLEIRIGKTYRVQEAPALDEYKRFELTEDGISHRAVPGQPKNMIFKTTGNEHNEFGRVDDTGPNRLLQMDKRMKKLDTIAKSFPDPQVFGVTPEEADVTIISWGSNKGIIL
ncbi:MAG: 2-oxoacid:acceptor oxidoreductase subunit alpha, partial [Candidatus Kariarchaeaceae archaeon]